MRGGWLALVLGCGACVGETSTMTAYGTAILAWTIDGRADASLCPEAGAVSVHVVLHTADDVVAGEDWATCADLKVRYFKRVGVYDADVTLTDARRAPISVTQRTGVFYVDEGREVRVVVDLVTTEVF